MAMNSVTCAPGRLMGLLVTLAIVPTSLAIAPAVQFELVPAADVQLFGPTYDYRIGRFEIRNDQFVAFLNDAMSNLTNDRGQYMYFDSTTGDVYINTTVDGEVGAGAAGRTTKLFSPATAGQIEMIDGAYQVVIAPVDYADHPVVGVTWYGAVKFCNWLTIASGLPEIERAYAEATAGNLNSWRPVTISAADWATRDLSSEERASLSAKLGYRLPMDDGTSGASAYNEWHKAASSRWEVDTVLFDALYGFGRSVITNADANFNGSDDPFEPGTTPVGFFDGVNLLGDLIPTNDTGNAYGLHDLAGNVWEWMQDQKPSDPTRRRNRGGSWGNPSVLLQVSIVAHRETAGMDDATGLRIVQSVLEDLIVTPLDGLDLSGPWGGPYGGDADSITYRFANVVSEAVTFEVATQPSVPWLTIEPAGGEIPPEGFVDVIVTIEPQCADEVNVGVNATTLNIRDDTGHLIADRPMQLTVTEPLTLTPPGDFNSTMPIGGTPSPPNTFYVLHSASDQLVGWTAEWAETSPVPSGLAWLQLLPAAGDVPGGGISPIVLSLDAAVTAMLVPGIHTADVTIVDDCTGEEFVRSVTLEITVPFTLTPEAASESSGVFGGPFAPDAHEFSITNLTLDAFNWTAALCAEAPGSEECTAPARADFELDSSGGQLPGGAVALVTASITTAANAAPPGTYDYTLRVTDLSSGFIVDRVVRLDVLGLRVEPETDVEFSGSLSGPFAPDDFVYVVQSSGVVPMEWGVTVELIEPGVNWINVDPLIGVILEPDGSADVTISLTSEAVTLPTGTYHADVTFTATLSGATTTRRVTLIVGSEAFSVAMALVPSDDLQALGAAHDFRIGRFEITNDEFVRFLNEKLRDPADQFLYHDADTGSVFIGAGSSSGTLIYNADVGRISFTTHPVDAYVVEDGFGDHPVVGVSWYGAAKFCNWMTLEQGMPAEARVYLESEFPEEWAPFTIDPAVLLTRPGFRLPTDDGADGASLYNEWHKAASRMGEDAEGDAIFGAFYGFGRFTIGDADANFWESGDTIENGTTPVGFFNGLSALLDLSLTRDTANGYRLYDASGNVSEWVHELTGSSFPPVATIRGGNYFNDVGFPDLRINHRQALAADLTLGFVGFRIAQALTPMPIRMTQGEDAVRATGPVGGPYSQETFTLLLDSEATYTLDDFSLSVSSSGAWLTFDGIPPQQVPPGNVIALNCKLGEGVDSRLVSPVPNGNMQLVSGRDGQLGGPTYDFWIGSNEVTNAEFAVFLNDSRSDLDAVEPGVQSDFLYFDLTTGDVYINDAQAGAEGTGAVPGAISTLLFDASIGHITPGGDTYTVETGFDGHPVVGVTWYGAVKYCNWLTIFTGIPSGLRAYAEDVDPNGWHPVTVSTSDWITRGMIDAERLDLVRRTVGYRLPMDGGLPGAGAHGEWYKAAAWDPVVAIDHAYGFGRDPVDGPAMGDANYLASGDTETEGTTPAGFFDGIHLLDDEATSTVDTDNHYALNDLCGNVAEWTQDAFVVGDISSRATRGGSWRDDVASPLLLNVGRGGVAPDVANDYTGFRVVRGTGHVATITVSDRITDTSETRHILLDLHEPLEMAPLGDTSFGPLAYCDDPAGTEAAFDVTNTSATEMPWAINVDQAWVTVTADGDEEMSGMLPGGGTEQFSLTITANDQADELPPGEHVARITLTNTFTDESDSREFSLTINQPIIVAPDEPSIVELEGFWGLPFDGLPTTDYALSRCEGCDCPLDYEVSTEATWLTLEPSADLTGSLPDFPTELAFAAGINEAANSLPIGVHTGVVHFAFVDEAHPAWHEPEERTIQLTVKDPVEITGEPGLIWEVTCEPDAQREYNLKNHHPSEAIGMDLSVDVNWIDIDRPSITLLPLGDQQTAIFSLGANAIETPGTYPIVLSFRDTLTGEVQTRELDVTITENMCITPLSGFSAGFRVGGSVTPPAAVYAVTNIEDINAASIAWSVTTDQPWVLVDGARSVGGTLTDGESAMIVVSIDSALAPSLPVGVREAVFEANVSFSLNGQPLSTRPVRLTVVEASFAAAEMLASAGTTPQPSGPVYAFMMGTYHTTNAEYVAFLNDAVANPGNERGEYLFFDSTNGDVYVNSVRIGQVGPDPGGRVIRIFSPAATEQIAFAEGVYSAVAAPVNYALHPIAGVTWFGALKYCNWLTLDQGMLPSQRCYAEGTDANDLAGWHPVTISDADWALRDLNDEERAELVGQYRGYRLPMDDGADNPDTGFDAADGFNEWYLAAAWNPALGRNMRYGFGDDPEPITGAFANYRCSGDPYEDALDCLAGGSTPVGFFDGVNLLADSATVTIDTGNGHDLYDLSGNVYQWMQDRTANNAGASGFRAVRGGSWNSGNLTHLEATFRNFAPHATISQHVGFRVVRTLSSVGDGDADIDGDVDLLDFAVMAACQSVPLPGALIEPQCARFDFNGDADVDLADAAAFSRFFTGSP